MPPEPDLEARFGVGRGVVREAVKTLAAKGMVSVRPRHGTHVLPRSEWSLLDRDVLSWLVSQDEPDRDLLLAIQEVRSIIEPAAAALAAEHATRNDRWRINTALAAMENAQDQTSAITADKAFHLAILDATHNPVLQGFRGAIDTILNTVFDVAVGSVGWFKDNLPNHAAAARAIESGDAEKARIAMERVLEYTKSKLRTGKQRSPPPSGDRPVPPRQRSELSSRRRASRERNSAIMYTPWASKSGRKLCFKKRRDKTRHGQSEIVEAPRTRWMADNSGSCCKAKLATIRSRTTSPGRSIRSIRIIASARPV